MAKLLVCVHTFEHFSCNLWKCSYLWVRWAWHPILLYDSSDLSYPTNPYITTWKIRRIIADLNILLHRSCHMELFQQFQWLPWHDYNNQEKFFRYFIDTSIKYNHFSTYLMMWPLFQAEKLFVLNHIKALTTPVSAHCREVVSSVCDSCNSMRTKAKFRLKSYYNLNNTRHKHWREGIIQIL